MVSSSLQDMESRYNRAIEEKTMLEQELIGKQQVEEEHQRLKDELRGKLKIRFTVVSTRLVYADDLSYQRPTNRGFCPQAGSGAHGPISSDPAFDVNPPGVISRAFNGRSRSQLIIPHQK